jgi:hypothetical protein
MLKSPQEQSMLRLIVEFMDNPLMTKSARKSLANVKATKSQSVLLTRIESSRFPRRSGTYKKQVALANSNF